MTEVILKSQYSFLKIQWKMEKGRIIQRIHMPFHSHDPLKSSRKALLDSDYALSSLRLPLNNMQTLESQIFKWISRTLQNKSVRYCFVEVFLLSSMKWYWDYLKGIPLLGHMVGKRLLAHQRQARPKHEINAMALLWIWQTSGSMFLLGGDAYCFQRSSRTC